MATANQRAALIRRNTTHGLSQVHRREYRTWKDMRARCNCQTRPDYYLYGERGIRVCERWNDFAAFFADMGPRPHGHTLDRIDTNGHYEPGNCRWATATVQANNKRTNHVLEIDGQAKTLQQWCRVYGVDHSKVRYRLKVGMPPKVALTAGDLRRVGS